MSASPDLLIELALTQLGVRERSGRNDGTPWERYQRRPKQENGAGWAWCAAFVLVCLELSGYPVPPTGGQYDPRRPWKNKQIPLHDVDAFARWCEESGWWFDPAEQAPRAGDLFFLGDRGTSDGGEGGHVGIIEQVKNGRIFTIEGNSRNAVRRQSYALTSPRIEGYARPSAFAA